MRHWLSKRAAFTRPNFGTAMSMSKTFAVETNSGGSRRISSIDTAPDFKSFFSCARLTRMSFARLRASILCSSERTGAWTWICGGAMSAASYQPHSDVQPSSARLVFYVDNSLECRAEHLFDRRESGPSELDVELCAHTIGCVGVSEEDRPERDVCRAARDELERITPGLHTAHADDGQLRRTSRCVHGGECDRFQRGSRVAAGRTRERRSQPRVERDPAQRVDEGDTVGACRFDCPHALADVPGMRRKFGVERRCGHIAAGDDDLGRGLR